MTLKNEKKIKRTSRTLAIIDYANIKSLLREKELQIDLEMLKKVLSEIGINDVRFYYGKDEQNTGIQKFFDVIEKFGYTLITKPVQYFRVKLSELIRQKNNQKLVRKLSKTGRLVFLKEVDNLEKANLTFLQPKANFDVEISVDVLEQLNEYDNFVLFSGDGDFVPLVEKLQKCGKQVVTVSGRKYFSGLLMKTANSFITIEKLIMVLPNLTYGIDAKNAATRRQILKKCTFSIATLNRLSSLFGVGVDKSL